MALQSVKNYLGPIYWEQEKVSGFTEMLQTLDMLRWFFLLDIDFKTWFQLLVSFCNEKLKGINLLAPCHLISVLCLFAPG